MRIRVVGAAGEDLRLARRAVREALIEIRLPREAQVAVALVGEADIRALNARHRGQDRVTDVLSFGAALPEGVRGEAAVPYLERGPDGSVELGDIVIATGAARRQAGRRRWSLAQELGFLAAHGALHLVGYEDDTQAGYREMRRRGLEALEAAQRFLKKSGAHKRPKH